MPDSQMQDVLCSFFLRALPATYVRERFWGSASGRVDEHVAA